MEKYSQFRDRGWYIQQLCHTIPFSTNKNRRFWNSAILSSPLRTSWHLPPTPHIPLPLQTPLLLHHLRQLLPLPTMVPPWIAI